MPDALSQIRAAPLISLKALEHIVYYIVLAPHSNEQSDMLHHLFVDPALARLDFH